MGLIVAAILIALVQFGRVLIIRAFDGHPEPSIETGQGR